MAKHAPEIIAFHLGCDMAEMRDHTYQPGSYRCSLYTFGPHYYAAPTAKSQLPKDWTWHKVATEYGRDIYRAHMNDDLVED